MAANQQALLMASGNAVVVEEACEADPYYSCGPTNDPYWANVVLMLHMDGTDGATTFTDSSSYARAMTAAGNAQIDTAEFKFGTASGLFDGTGDSVQTPNGADFQFLGDFTVEAWVRPTTTGSFTNIFIQDNGTVNAWWLRKTNLNELGYGVVGGSDLLTGGTINSNVWTHVAICRSGTTLRLFVNGLQVNAGTGYSATIGIDTGTAEIGGGSFAYTGQIDDLRITKGVARYTGNFNIPTAAFPDALQAPQLGVIERVASIVSSVSSNTIAIPAHLPGDMVVLAARSASATIPTLPPGCVNIASSSPAFSSGIRLFYVIDQTGAIASLISTNAVVFVGAIYRNAVGVGAAAIGVMQGPETTATIAGAAFSADYGQSRAFVGVSWNQSSSSGTVPTDHYEIASDRTIGPWIAAYDITPPTTTYAGGTSTGLTNGYGVPWTVEIQAGEAYPFQPRTVLSLHADDVTVEDSSCYQPKTITLEGTLGNLAVVTDVESRFGGKSFYVPNSGSSSTAGVVITDHQDLDFGTGDFTIEMWAYRSSNTYYGTLFYFTEAAEFSLLVAPTTGNIVLNYRSSGGTQANISTGVTFPLTTWQHVVVQRRGTNFEFYLHGVLGNTTAITGGASSAVNSAGDFYLGRTNASSALSWNGYIDEARVTKGVARYPAAFTPPAQPNCDSVVPGSIVAVDGTSPLTGASVTVQQQTIGYLNGSVVLSGSSSTVYAGGLFANSVTQNKTVALTGRSVTVSRGSLTVPPYPSLATFTTSTVFVATGSAATSLTLSLRPDGLFMLTDSNGATRETGSWIDTVQTNYNIESISHQYRVLTVNVFEGAFSRITYPPLPFVLDSVFSLVLDNPDSFSRTFNIQVTVTPTITNPRYGEAFYYGVFKISAFLNPAAS